jgi:hypothetical protein
MVWTDKQDNLIVGIMGVEALIYCAFLSFVLYMIYQFLIKMKFYKQWHLTTFYTITVLILVLRVIFFMLAIDIYTQGLG